MDTNVRVPVFALVVLGLLQTSSQEKNGGSAIAFPEHTEVAIIGGGMAGIMTFMKLIDEGKYDPSEIAVFEKGTDLGGVWHWNKYPGCALDSTVRGYFWPYLHRTRGLSIWKSRWADQPEVLATLHHIVDTIGMKERTMLNAKLVRAVFDELHTLWNLEFEDGHTVSSKYVIDCHGRFYIPKKAEISGLEKFSGLKVHSAEWDASINVTGKTVAVLGSGPTAVQIAPNLAQTAGGVYFVQRHPNICLRKDMSKPKDFRATHEFLTQGDTDLFSQLKHMIFGKPKNEKTNESLDFFHTQEGQHLNLLVESKDFVRDTVRNLAYQDVLTANYTAVCKHPSFCSDLFSCFNNGTVSLVDVLNKELLFDEEHMIVGDDPYKIDVLVWATGFQAGTPEFDALGRQGKSLLEHLGISDGPPSYHGIMFPGFPNWFTVNELFNKDFVTGRNIVPLFFDSTTWIAKVLKSMKKSAIDTVEPTREASEEYLKVCQRFAKASYMVRCPAWDEHPGDSCPFFDRPSYLKDVDMSGLVFTGPDGNAADVVAVGNSAKARPLWKQVLIGISGLEL